MIIFSVITPSQLSDIASQIHESFYANDLDNLVFKINELIQDEVELSRFNVSLQVRGMQPNVTVPREIMFLHQEFRGRGFTTQYKSAEDDTATFKVSWSNPEMTSFDVKSKKYWGKDLLPSLGLNAKAFEYYLVLTGGQDLRSYAPNIFIKDVQDKLIKNTLRGVKIFDYYGPDDCFLKSKNESMDQSATTTALANLFEEAADHLREKGYGVVDISIPWVISYT